MFGPKIHVKTALHIVDTKINSTANTDRGITYNLEYGSNYKNCQREYQGLDNSIFKAILSFPASITVPGAGLRGDLGRWSANGKSSYLFLMSLFRLKSSDKSTIHEQLFKNVEIETRTSKPKALPLW